MCKILWIGWESKKEKGKSKKEKGKSKKGKGIRRGKSKDYFTIGCGWLFAAKYFLLQLVSAIANYSRLREIFNVAKAAF